MRRPEPWYRQQNDAWYVTVGGEQKMLCKGEENKDKAYEEFYKIMAADGQAPPPKKLTLGELVERFRKWSQDEHAATTHVWYNGHLDSLLDFKDYKKRRAADLKPSDISKWVASRKLGQSTKRGAITVAKSLYSWGATNCGLPRDNPIRDMERPAMKRREAATAEQRSQILAAVQDEPFLNFLTVVMECGCRPGEAMKLTAEMVRLDEGVIVFAGKTTAATGKNRVIYMTDKLRDLLKTLVALNPSGPLLLNTDDGPWNTNAVRCRFRRLRAKLKMKGVVCYSLRHAFVTDGLEAGVPIAQMAELAGHSDTKIISSVYSHLQERREHLREQAEKAATRK